jgi:hypothetical protein
MGPLHAKNRAVCNFKLGKPRRRYFRSYGDEAFHQVTQLTTTNSPAFSCQDISVPLTLPFEHLLLLDSILGDCL